MLIKVNLDLNRLAVIFALFKSFAKCAVKKLVDAVVVLGKVCGETLGEESLNL